MRFFLSSPGVHGAVAKELQQSDRIAAIAQIFDQHSRFPNRPDDDDSSDPEYSSTSSLIEKVRDLGATSSAESLGKRARSRDLEEL
jgi:hypothetical protein